MQPDSFYHLLCLSSVLSLLSLKALSHPPALFLPAPQPFAWDSYDASAPTPTRPDWENLYKALPHALFALGVLLTTTTRLLVCALKGNPTEIPLSEGKEREEEPHAPYYGLFLATRYE